MDAVAQGSTDLEDPVLVQVAPLVDAFRAEALPREVWSHEAHLLVGWALVRELGDADRALEVLAPQIRRYNRRSGLPVGRRDCHVTLTRYFLLAVEAAAPTTIGELLIEPWCSRRAPDRHWSPVLLGSPEARRRWVEPDLRPLPWRVDHHETVDAVGEEGT